MKDNKEYIIWDKDNKEYIIWDKENKPCLHDSCSSCGGTGIRKDGLGPCIHMISCSCPKCNPF